METKVAEITLAKATIYSQSDLGLGLRKTEARNLKVQIIPYAQYANAVEITFIPKGKRNERVITETTHAATVVLAGWGHALQPDGVYLPATKAETGAETARGRYRSCDSRWVSDFMSSLAAYASATGAEIALNCVGHVVVEKVRAMTPRRSQELYTAARDWAENEATACGAGPLPEWVPPVAGARAAGAQTAEEIDHVISAACESWRILRTYWNA